MKTIVRSRPWLKEKAPKKILAIRYQAMGDLVITLPYLQSLKNALPAVELHLLTRREVKDIPRNLLLFDKVMAIGGGRSAKVQFFLSLLSLPFLWLQHYDVVLDLQNHRISRILRWLLFPPSWSEFDRSSPVSAGERTRLTIDAVRLPPVRLVTVFDDQKKTDISGIMKRHGWNGESNLVILNPAGAFITRNWPMENYERFATLWLENVDSATFFVIVGLKAMSEKASFLKERLKERVIDLAGKTTPFEAFRIITRAKFVLTEDSGLMHMSWVQGVPTLALFGSSRGDWSAPLGSWSRCLDSSDLSCRFCMKEICQYGDVRCLIRYTPEGVLKAAQELILKHG